MVNIELVVKISEEQYNVIKSDLYNTFPAEMKEWGLEAIKNGTPLPKGHGRLIDASDLMPDSDYEDGTFYAVSIGQISLAPTIIEADKAESEDKLDGNPVDIDKAIEHYEGTLEVLKDIDLEVDNGTR